MSRNCVKASLEFVPSSQMRAVGVFPRKREIEEVSMKTPRITAADQVFLKILEVGICGTDREISSFEYGTPPKDSEFLIIGHEMLGEIVDVGRAVKSVKIGDLAVLTVRRPCTHKSCAPCRAGYPDFCNSDDYIERGIKGAQGFMSEFVVDNVKYVHRVPRNLRNVAVLTEPLTIAEKAIDQSISIVRRLPWLEELDWSNMKIGHRLGITSVVLGAGAVGLLGAMALISAGSDTYVYALPHAPNPGSEFVESIGGKYYSPGKISTETRKKLLGHVHLIYEATGSSRLAFSMLKILGHNSEFVLTGVPSLKGPYEIDGDLLMRDIVLKNQVLFGSVNASSENFDEAIRDLANFEKRWPGRLGSLIGERVPFDKAPEALGRGSKGIKTVVSFD